MLITYDNLIHLRADDTLKTSLLVAAAGRLLFTLSSSDFNVEYHDGKASVTLSRHISDEQARGLAHALLKRVEVHEAQQASFAMATQARSKV
jgi:hypothetical protein